jgi:GNAT superfamily N-acetyltransferase
MKRALMAVGPGSDSEVSLRKKSNKSRINRLERIAPLRLVKLETEEELAAVLQPIADYCDLRQGAVNAATPFRTDRLKYEFYLAMMRVPGLLHATVLKLGDEVVAAHIGQRDRTHVSLGLIAHSPFVAEHSPGKLLVLMLGVLLGKEGYQNFDLTPGGSYKDRFATHYDEAHVLDVFMSPIASARHATTRQLVSLVKRGAERVGTDPEVLKEFAATALGQVPRWLRSSTPPKLVRHVRRRIYNDAEFRFYRMSAAEAADMQPDAVTMKRDDVADLLCYERASHSDVSERDFLMRALRRIEEGQHVYTYVEDGRLLHYCWLIDRQEVTYSDFGQRVELPPNTSVLYDDYTHPAARGRGLHKAGLRQRLRDAARIPGAEWIAIGVLASNTPSRRNIEAVGFTCFCRAFVQTRGRSKRGWVACT